MMNDLIVSLGALISALTSEWWYLPIAIILVLGAYWLVKKVLARIGRSLPKEIDERWTLLAALMATGFAGTGMWHVFGEVLGFTGPLRLLFAFLEVAVLASAYRARRNVRESDVGDAGIDGKAMWVFTTLSAVLSALDSKSFIEVLARLSAPLIAAWLWERNLHGEREKKRERKPKRRIHYRFTLERALILLGVAEPSERDASAVDAHRRLTRVALAAKTARALPANARAGKRARVMRELDKAIRKAVEHAGLGSVPERREQVLTQLGVLATAERLITMELPSAWENTTPATLPPALAPAPEPIEQPAPAPLPAPPAPRPQPKPAPAPAPRSAEENALAFFREQLARDIYPRSTDLKDHTGAGASTARKWHRKFRQMPEHIERIAEIERSRSKGSAQSAPASATEALAQSGEHEHASVPESAQGALGEHLESGEQSTPVSEGEDAAADREADEVIAALRAEGNGHATPDDITRPLATATANGSTN
ncbi:hypothetical protein ABT352_33440 [Streptosporangium sp. NPDC000563]|uniref:hypothetical protein n=1 Tax=Streptosporangium sp. NPDC000563 TaxID=3154366 RepID=UPI0033210E21